MIPSKSSASRPRRALRRTKYTLMTMPAWCASAFLALFALLIWSYGTNNIPVPGTKLPLVDVVFALLLFRTRKYWVRGDLPNWARQARMLLLVLTVATAVRLSIDIHDYGNLALRDALFVVEAWAILLGYSLAVRLGRPEIIRRIGLMFVIAVFWFLAYPARDSIEAWSPIVGIQRPVPLLTFTSTAHVSAWALLWFLGRKDLKGHVLTSLAVVGLLFAQSRGAFVGTALSAIVMWIVRPRWSTARRYLRLASLGALALVVFSILPPLPGRLGAVRPEVLVDLAATGLGREGQVSSSFDDRTEWLSFTVGALTNEPIRLMVGVGLGVDLADGFTADGVLVRKPHNDFLEAYARLGLGSLPWFGLWFVTLRELVRRSRLGDRLASWGLGASMVTILISLTQPFSAFAYGGLVWWLLAGMVLGAAPKDRSGGGQRSPAGLNSAVAHDGELVDHPLSDLGIEQRLGMAGLSSPIAEDDPPTHNHP